MTLSRRVVLSAGAAVLVGAAVESPARAATSVVWASHPATSTVGIVLMSGLPAPGTASVMSGTTVVSSSAIVGGRAILRIPTLAGRTRILRMTAPGYTTWVRVSTDATALQASPWRFVNKRHALPSWFQPSPLRTVGGHPLRSDAAGAYLRLQAAAWEAGYGMSLSSGYRSYATQVETYDYWVRLLGQAQADRVAAHPGFSEHQTGLAMDVRRPDNYCTVNTCFGTTGLGRWLAANCHRFGFIVRYPAGEEPVTGYSYEPWHLRYLGVAMSQDYHARGAKSLESYFGFPAAPTY